MHRPKLSQHFLRDPRVIETILQAAELEPTDSAMEIGPGKGVLTDPLSRRVKHLIAVEFDRVLASKIQARFAANPHVQIIQADFLTIPLSEVCPGSVIKVLGNLPYAITSPIFEKLLAWPGWTTGVFLIQKEVADRMRSGPGSKVFGILSLAVQLFAEVELITKVPPGAFTPPPRVHSAVIRLRRKTSLPIPEAEIPAFFDLAHAAFSHRRKTLANSVAIFSSTPRQKVEAWLEKNNVRPAVRAESLGLEEYARLAAPWAIFRRETKLT